MKHKKICAALMAAMIGIGTMAASPASEAASREEIAKISVNKQGTNFKYWNKDAASYKALTGYVKDITDKCSKNFIPVEDRIAVFDVDGTLACETAPFCFDFMMFIHRALDDSNYTASAQDRENAEAVKNAIYNHKMTNDVRRKHCLSNASVFAGMTPAEYADYTKNYFNTPVEGFTNLKVGEIFYLPMVEVVSYLRANDFKIFLVSGAEREYTRILAEVLAVDSDNIIGTDYSYVAENQGDKDGMDYVYKVTDKLVRGDFVSKNINTNKVNLIAREIGKQPILAFGNSSGDYSMFNYTSTNPKYKTKIFALLCDDIEREFGKTSSAEKMKKAADENGWIAVSMKNDFKTIYGDNVARVDQ